VTRGKEDVSIEEVSKPLSACLHRGSTESTSNSKICHKLFSMTYT